MGAKTKPSGVTLVEILVATVLTLIVMVVAVQIFSAIGESVSNAQAMLEISERLRSTRTRLEMDLAGITATMLPPRHPETAEGYFEYIEGPIGVDPSAEPEAVDSDNANAPDTTVGDFDDILMFTTRSADRPFLGRCALAGGTIESHVAEVVWFLRGRTLYRRVMLVVPGVDVSSIPLARFFADNDISAHPVFHNVSGKPVRLVANTLADLTKRECRYAHRLHGGIGFPFDARLWGQLGLPTLRECSSAAWFDWDNASGLPSMAPVAEIDLWNNPHPWRNVDRVTGTLSGYEGPRVAEDVILTNVISFDVKAWDPGAPVISDGSVVLVPGDPGYPANPAAPPSGWPVVSYGAYVDLGYAPGYSPASNAPTPRFHHAGELRSGLNATASQPARVYDTWSFHYEHDGIDQYDDGNVDMATNGFDDNVPGIDDDGDGSIDEPGESNGIVDDVLEMETSPPYPVPLRAIQVKIRVFEPDSRQIREVTVVQDFLLK